MSKRILIVGIGNELRGDDGIGAYICRCIEEKKIEGVHTLISHQLHTELAEEFLAYDHIVIADASVNEKPVEFYPLKPGQLAPASSSHHVNASMLAAIAKQLYNKELSIMICSVKAEDFEIGSSLSALAKNNADSAAGIIINWISSVQG